MARSKRESAGRTRKAKPKPEPKARTRARRRLQAQKVADAERAYALLVEWMEDGTNPNAFRRSCAHDVIDYVDGKAKEGRAGTPDTAVTDVSQLSDEERAARVAAILDKARVRAGGRTDRGTRPGGCAP